ncbi:MAG: hypothetical protein SH848_15875 [Saprospiraceae bacterium]|nr:hypothetical protein [Saprospiraceae bacterium]MDZ4705403.1 hypothetical protein [Saprospiraceae bacterium]
MLLQPVPVYCYTILHPPDQTKEQRIVFKFMLFEDNHIYINSGVMDVVGTQLVGKFKAKAQVIFDFISNTTQDLWRVAIFLLNLTLFNSSITFTTLAW